MIIMRVKEKQNTYLSIETSILTPFCSFLEVSTVKNNSTILQFGNLVSIEQPYSRKLIISKSRTALKPLKTLLAGSKIQSILMVWNQPWISYWSRSLTQLCKFLSLIHHNQTICQLWIQMTKFNVITKILLFCQKWKIRGLKKFENLKI